VEIVLALAAFGAMCCAVLLVAPQSAEPDDGAYHASIVGITDGHWLTLSLPQAEGLAAKLHDNPAAPPGQWVELPDRRYISEKDPGYPFLAAPFQALGIIRWAPLFYGALGCLGLFAGARRWLGSFGGFTAVGLYCSSGAAASFAWRDYMPTFTDASLVAAGTGTLLWTMLNTDASPRRRSCVGLLGFVALEVATFARYTNIVILGTAVLAVVITWWLRAANLPARSLAGWLGSVAVAGAGIAAFNDLVYGGPLTSGYSPGEITFSLRAISPNLRLVPAHLVQAMPMLFLGLAAAVWISARAIVGRHGGREAIATRRDLGVGAAIFASWLATWSLYATYTWTTDPTNSAVSDVRFYVPALGAISLLGAWLVTRLGSGHGPRGVGSLVTTAAMFALGVWAFHAMYAAFGVPLG
jgi:hypothetical protein